MEAELNIQRQLTADTVLEVGYLGSESHFLQRFLTLNMPATMSPTATVDSREPDPSFGISSMWPASLTLTTTR
jgi:hypothetical protein